jgi:hypothetical protein
MRRSVLFFLFLLLTACLTDAQTGQTITEESQVPDYQLPDVLTRFNGRKVKSEKEWIKKRRPEILKVFTEDVYGKVPGELLTRQVDIRETSDQALNGLAVRKQIALIFKKENHSLELNVLMYLPKRQKKSPVFLAYNFSGNHTISYDPNIRLTEAWVADNPSIGIINNQVTEQSRGTASDSWPVEQIIGDGYGLVTAYYGEVDPDKDDFSDGIQSFFYQENQTRPKADEWGSIAAWAWGLSRIMDYLETDSLVDARHVAVLGHSRLGKTALWAGATDQRFAMVISNESGCSGAALSRRRFGETVWRINTSFPHWFCSNFKKYNRNEDALPVDQHELLALVAPRPLYVASAEGDLWSDPRGEFLSAKYASPVYRLFGLKGLQITEMPPVDQPVMGTIGYHIRSGKHNLTDYDWTQYLKFADMHFRLKD